MTAGVVCTNRPEKRGGVGVKGGCDGGGPAWPSALTLGLIAVVLADATGPCGGDGRVARPGAASLAAGGITLGVLLLRSGLTVE